MNHPECVYCHQAITVAPAKVPAGNAHDRCLRKRMRPTGVTQALVYAVEARKRPPPLSYQDARTLVHEMLMPVFSGRPVQFARRDPWGGFELYDRSRDEINAAVVDLLRQLQQTGRISAVDPSTVWARVSDDGVLSVGWTP